MKAHRRQQLLSLPGIPRVSTANKAQPPLQMPLFQQKQDTLLPPQRDFLSSEQMHPDKTSSPHGALERIDRAISTEKTQLLLNLNRCHICTRTFSTRSNFLRHKTRVHSNSPYKYLRHIKVEGKFQCQLCTKQYSHTSNLRVHIFRCHNNSEIGGRSVTQKMILPRKSNDKAAEEESKESQDVATIAMEQLLLPFDEKTKSFIKDFQAKIPLLASMLFSSPMRSPFQYELEEEIEVKFIDYEVVKFYRTGNLLEGCVYQNRLQTEAAISQTASQLMSECVIHLRKIYLSIEHIALSFKRYSEDFRDYLRLRRDPLMLNLIFLKILKGIEELHSMGYVHRDLKPDNVVLNIEPLEVVLIDFNRSLLDTTISEGSVLGTQGYFPMASKWRDGSKKWDIWSLAAMVLEADMLPDAYLHTRDEKGAKQKFHQHSLHPHTSQALRDLVSKIFFAKREEPPLSYLEIQRLIEKIQFRKY